MRRKPPVMVKVGVNVGNNLLAGSAFWFYEECQLNGFIVWQAVALNCSYIVLSDKEGYKLQKWW